MSDTRRTALVTGAARGLGRAIATSFAAAGYDLVLSARSTRDAPNRLLPGALDEVHELIETKFGVSALSVPGDLAVDGFADHLATATLERFGRCDVLVNNAAFIPPGSFLDLPPRRWEAAVKVNVLAPARLCQLLVPGMLDRGSGSVVNISSGAAVDDVALMATYGVTKAALERLGSMLEFELGGRGVSFTTIRIDEQIVTEANMYMAAKIALDDPTFATRHESGRCSPAEFGEAVRWVAEQGDLSPRLLTLGDLRSLGALPAV